MRTVYLRISAKEPFIGIQVMTFFNFELCQYLSIWIAQAQHRHRILANGHRVRGKFYDPNFQTRELWLVL